MKGKVYFKSQALLLVMVMMFLFIAAPLKSVEADAATPGINVSVYQSSVYVGGKMTVTAYGSGTRSPYKYKFIYKVDSGSWITLRDYTASNTVTFTMGKAGTYTIRSYVKDANNSLNYYDQKMTCKAKYVPLSNNTTISSTNISIRQAVAMYGKASGGTPPYKYAYYYTKVGGAKTTIKDFSTATVGSIRLAAGYYKFDCIVKDSAGKTATKSFCGVTVKNDTGKALKNTSFAPEISDVTSTIKITGSGSGGYKPYRYSFYYSTDGKNYQKITENSQNPYANLKLNYTGFYTVKTVVKDYAGKLSTKYLSITSRKNTSKALSFSASVDCSDLVDQGAAVTMRAFASNGVLPYKYAFYYQYNSGSWQTVRSYGIVDNASIKLSNAGKYVLKVCVKDAAGKIIEKKFNVESLSRQSYQSTLVSSKNTAYGFTATVNAVSKGAGARYSFYYKKTNDYFWTKLKNNSTSRTASFRPRELREYTVMVRTTVGSAVYTSTYKINPTIDNNIYEVHRLINNERRKAGLNPLVLDTNMVFISGVRAEELNKRYEHIRPDGRKYSTIFDEYDVDFSTSVGENNASVNCDPEEVVNAWMKSEKHRDNILSAQFTREGLNYSGRFWNELFAN